MDIRTLFDFTKEVDGCWIWQRAANNKGYGVCAVGRGMRLAHRMAYAIVHGPIPTGISVLHHCDTPLCINPDHLFLGTQMDNVHDAMQKGRHKNPPLNAHYRKSNPQRGSKSKNAKITEAIAKHIMLERMTGRNFTDLGHEVGLDASVVADICKGLAWAHVLGVDGAPTLEELASVPVYYNWTDTAKRRERVDAIRPMVVEMIRDGHSPKDIMMKTGVKKPTFYRILRGDR